MRTVALVGLIASTILAAPLAAQDSNTTRATRRPMLAVHLGRADVEQTGGVTEFGASLDVGGVRGERLRLVLGVDRYSGDPDRGPTPGTFSDLNLSVDLRYKPFRLATLVPYVGAGIGLHVLDSDIDNANVAAIYDGVAVGAQLFGGVLVDGNAAGRWGFVGELRSVFAQNLDRSGVRVGLFLRF